MGRGDGSSSSDDAGDADYDDAMSSSGAEASSYSGYEEEEELSSAESMPASSSGAAERSSGYEEAAADSAGEEGEDGIQEAEQAHVRDVVVEEEGTGRGGEDGIQADTSAGTDDGGGDEWAPSMDDDASGEEDYAEVPRSRRSPDGDDLVGGGEEEHPAPQFTEGDDDAAVAAGEEDDDINDDESQQDTTELRKIKKKKIQDILDAQNASIDADMNKGKEQLEYILKQTELFAYFYARSQSADDISRGRSCRSRGRHGSKLTEEEEDTEYLKEEEDALAGAGATLTRLVSQPSCIKGNMREYQLAGLNWLIQLYENGINGILADEMGLGKTLQTISLLGYLHEFKGITGPHMIVAPKSTLGNWINEIQRFCPILRAVKLLGNTNERNHIKEQLLVPGRFDVCVTSFEMVIKEKTALMRFSWRYIIIDEAHRIKNENSLLSKTMRLYKTNYRLLITGTPLQNNLHELWSLLNFLLPEIFSSAQTFDEWFQISGENDQHEVIQKLHKVLRPFLLRRLKSDVEKGLPPKIETILKVGMSHMQKQYYCAILQKDLGAISSGGECKLLLNIAMQLRKCCNHPYLFQGAELGPPYTIGDHLIENSGKMVLLDKLLAKLKERGSRVLIFSQMTRLLDILEDYLEYREYQYCRIDGSTGVEDRDASIEAFNTLGSQKFIFLLSTRAGCLGINLYTADVVILYDSDWNPQVDLQAQDRAHRIGQKKDVQVFRFCTEHTIEEKIIERAYKKLALDALVIQQGRFAEHKAVSKDELLEMVRFGAELVFSSNDSTLTDEDIDHIIANGEKATAELDSKMKKFTEDAIRFKIDNTAELYNFDSDKDRNNIGFRKLAINNSIEPLRRERKSHNYCEDDYFRKAFGEDAPSKPRKTRTPRMMQMHDFQFINTQRLNELYEKEAKYNVKSKKKNDTVGNSAIEDCPEPLTAEEQLEKQKLLEEGFPYWTKKDFHTFLKACEKHGRNDLNNIAFEMKKVGIKEEEVQRYSAVFNKRFMELKDYERIIKNIEKGEARVVQKERIMKFIERKMVQYKDPPSELKIQYGQNRAKSSYSKECDRFMLCTVHKLGYGNWDELRLAIRMSPLFKHDWFIKSRSADELSKRRDTLIRLVEKELAHERIDQFQSTLLAPKRPHPDTPTVDRSGLSSYKRMRDALPNQSPGRR